MNVDWQRAAERLFRTMEDIEVMSDPTIPAPDGINRKKQINMFARDAIQSYTRNTQQEKT